MRRNDNRGLSIVELVIVIAIIAVMLTGAVISVSLLFGTEAKQAAAKTEAQLNNIKTEAMSRYSEYMVIRYISEEDPDKGVDKPGYYAIKTAYTIDNAADIPGEYTRQTIKVEPDKESIKQAIQMGRNVPGAHLEMRTSLRIK